MRKIGILSLYLVFTISLTAQTTVSGGIYQNTVWSISGSPYIVTGSIVVFPGKTLTIEPGCEILIDNQTTTDIYIEARGGISMIGAPGNSIRIRTLYDTTAVGWRGFKCISSQGGFINADRFSISNAQFPFDVEGNQNVINYTDCDFSYNQQAIRVDSSIVLNSCTFRNNDVGVYGWSHFDIIDCQFENNSTAINAYATRFSSINSTFTSNNIGIQFSSLVFEEMTIDSCTFFTNGIGINEPNNGSITNSIFDGNSIGIDFAHNCSITNNLIKNNGIGIAASFEAEVLNNNIATNSTGVAITNLTIASLPPVIVNNEICSNANYNVDNQTNLNLSLETNCFCGLDSAQIELFLFDGYDDITKGLLNYSLFDSTCLILYGTVNKFENPAAEIADHSSFDYKFANPVSDWLILHNTTENTELFLMDVNGKLIKKSSIHQSAFDVRDVKPGVYFIKFKNNNIYSSTRKIIKI